MRSVIFGRTIILAALAVGAAASAVAAEKLSGDELRQAVAGKQIFLATPFGGEFPLNYRSNGTVDGSGKAIGLGKWMQPTDSGRWWIEGSKLCQKWSVWYKGKEFCFTVTPEGPKKISWVRDDGLAGTARVED